MYFEKKFEICKSDIKKTWDTIKELIKKKKHRPQLPTSFLHDKKYTNNPTEIANNFNEFFSNIGPNLAKQFDKHSSNFKQYLEGNHGNSMFLTEIETSEVFEIISQRKPNKSHGYDGVRSTQYFYLNNHYNHFALKNILCLPCLYALQISKPLKHLPINIWSAANTFIWLIPIVTSPKLPLMR